MIRFSSSAASLFLALFFCVPTALAQEQKPETFRDGNSIEWFNEAANFRSDKLLFKALQYKAPYPGYYQEWRLDKDGRAFNGGIVPNWAVQNSSFGKLSDSPLDEVKRLLTNLAYASHLPVAKPQKGELYTAFVFYDGKTYARYDYNGALPAEAQGILDFVNAEIAKQEKLRHEQWLERRTRNKEIYGDWKNKPGVIVGRGHRMQAFKNAQGALLSLTGQRRISEAKLAGVSVYHAIVFYPEGVITGSGSGGEYGSDEPFSSQVMIWTLKRNAAVDKSETEEKRLEIKYNALDETVSIGSKVFPLAVGNLFIIRMDERWTPIVTQISAHLNEPVDDQKVLDYFKSLRSDEMIQTIEIYPSGKM